MMISYPTNTDLGKTQETDYKYCAFFFHQMSTNFLALSVSSSPEVIKLFSCSTQLSLKFIINDKIAKINGNLKFRSHKPVIYPADKC